VRITAETDGFVLEPLDVQAFGALLSTDRRSDAERHAGEERGARVLAAIRALLAGDVAPLHTLYGGNVTVERVNATWKERIDRFKELQGNPIGATLLGTARRGGDDFILVQFRFERGAEDVAFVWNGRPDGKLAGISPSGMPANLRFRAEESGGYAAFDRRSGASVGLHAERSRLVIRNGATEIDAVKSAARNSGRAKRK
jgi:hypothetical protein